MGDDLVLKNLNHMLRTDHIDSQFYGANILGPLSGQGRVLLDIPFLTCVKESR